VDGLEDLSDSTVENEILITSGEPTGGFSEFVAVAAMVGKASSKPE
jgi:hypothetical protein